MKLQLIVTYFVLALVPTAIANFSIFQVHRYGTQGNNFDVKSYMIFDTGKPTSCAQVTEEPLWWWGIKNDVSGNKLGVRCKGSGCGLKGPVSNIDELEMNFSTRPVYHWTMYKNRNRDLFGLDGRKYGHCVITTGNDFDCGWSGVIRIHGYRKFYCYIRYTAWDIKTGNSRKVRRGEDIFPAEEDNLVSIDMDVLEEMEHRDPNNMDNVSVTDRKLE